MDNAQNAVIEGTHVEAVRTMTNKDVVAMLQAHHAQIIELQAKVVELTSRLEATAAAPKAEGKEMTDADARSVLFGDHKDLKHKDAAAKLGLTYGQVYSCRLGFTFKAIHKEMAAQNIKNTWMK